KRVGQAAEIASRLQLAVAINHDDEVASCLANSKIPRRARQPPGVIHQDHVLVGLCQGCDNLASRVARAAVNHKDLESVQGVVLADKLLQRPQDECSLVPDWN